MNPNASLLDRAGLDKDKVGKLLKRGLEGADDGELFLEYKQSEVMAFDNGRLKTATYDTNQGFGLRAVKDEIGVKLNDVALAHHVGAHGVHLTARQLSVLGARPDLELVGASCHNRAELEAAQELGADFAVLGPVCPTPSSARSRAAAAAGG